MLSSKKKWGSTLSLEELIHCWFPLLSFYNKFRIRITIHMNNKAFFIKLCTYDRTEQKLNKCITLSSEKWMKESFVFVPKPLA